MSRVGRGARALVAIALAGLLAGVVPTTAVAQTTPDRSEVVLVLDFSASILNDAANRNRFGAALERIADRVDATSADLVAGDATVSFVQFATKAVDVGGCVGLELLDSAQNVARFADCLRTVAAAYRKGSDAALAKRIGVDTNYVVAMEQAAKHLPATAVRPALILFTDGKHDVNGVPVSQVPMTRDRLFGTRSPFALLPVGMGLDPAERTALEAGLVSLRIIREMPACVGGSSLAWPQVVFDSPDEAGNAVAVALQDTTCTFTVAPTPKPSTAPVPAAVRNIRLTPGDGRIEVAWTPPAVSPVPVVDYQVRCRAGEGDWIESTEGVSTAATTTIEGVSNGTVYSCEVAAVGAASQGAWTAAAATVTPIGRPGPPARPSVEALDRALRVSVTPGDPAVISGYHYECSSDNGGTWTSSADAPSGASPATQVANLTNGVAYVCRAFAESAVGRSDASPLSDAVRPCGSFLDCNSLAQPLVVALGALILVGILVVGVLLVREGRRGYVVAVLDVVHTGNLGHGSRLGIGFVRADSGKITGIVADRGRGADVRIRQLRGGRFEVTDSAGRHVAASGEPIVTTDAAGIRHELVLHAFDTNPASSVSSRR